MPGSFAESRAPLGTHGGRRCPILRTDVLIEVDNYQARTGCTDSLLAEKAMNNTSFIRSLRDGTLNGIDEHRAAKLRRYMAANPDGPGQYARHIPQPHRGILERLAVAKAKAIARNWTPNAFYLNDVDHAAFMATKPGTVNALFRGWPRTELGFDQVPVRPIRGAISRAQPGSSKLYATGGSMVGVPMV